MYVWSNASGSAGVKTPLRTLNHVNVPDRFGSMMSGEFVAVKPTWSAGIMGESNLNSKVAPGVGSGVPITNSTCLAWFAGSHPASVPKSNARPSGWANLAMCFRTKVSWALE
jgi:hypothetical protein